jgi:hypothetical protein
MVLRLRICMGLAAGLGLALFPMPFAYYELLRIAVCAGLGFLAFTEARTRGRAGWIWGLALLAILFNPLVPVHVGRAGWAIIDIFVAPLILFYGWGLFTEQKDRQTATQMADAATHGHSGLEADQQAEEKDVAEVPRFTAAKGRAIRREERLEAVTALALECGAKGERPGNDEMAIVLSEHAFERLRGQYAGTAMPDKATAELRDALVILIATDAVSQQLNVQWETLSLGMHAGWMVGQAGADIGDEQVERIGEIFRRALDLQAYLAKSTTAQPSVEAVGSQVTGWMFGGGYAELDLAVDPIHRLQPEITTFARATA